MRHLPTALALLAALAACAPAQPTIGERLMADAKERVREVKLRVAAERHAKLMDERAEAKRKSDVALALAGRPAVTHRPTDTNLRDEPFPGVPAGQSRADCMREVAANLGHEARVDIGWDGVPRLVILPAVPRFGAAHYGC